MRYCQMLREQAKFDLRHFVCA